MDNNPDFVIIKQGAEGRIYRGAYLQRPTIVKERFRKKYRHPDLDESLTKERIRAEVRSISRCKEAGIHTPAIYLVDYKRRCIFMEEIENSSTAKDYISKLQAGPKTTESKDRLQDLGAEIGKSISKMHSSNIIHGDLTTSNILVRDSKVYFIDFGLSNFSLTAEDKAVDLYVLERALLSTHENAHELFLIIMTTYRRFNKQGKEIIVKLDDVRARGRKRSMIG